MVENTSASSSIAVGFPASSAQLQPASRYYFWGGKHRVLDNSPLTRARILHSIRNAHSAQQLHILKGAPFVDAPDRSFDWFLGCVQLVNDKVTLPQWVNAIHVLQPALAKHPASFYTERLSRAGYTKVADLKDTTARQLAADCGFSTPAAEALVFHASQAPVVWPYSKYMQSRLGVDRLGDLRWQTKLRAWLLQQPLPNVPEHWL